MAAFVRTPYVRLTRGDDLLRDSVTLAASVENVESMKRIDTDLLGELIDDKHNVLVALRELSHRQVNSVKSGDMSELLAILASKQTQLARLQELEGRLDPFRREDPESRTWRRTEDRRRCRTVAQHCEALVNEIMLMEKQSEIDAMACRELDVRKLDDTQNAAQARTAYSRRAVSQGVHLDLASTS